MFDIFSEGIISVDKFFFHGMRLSGDALDKFFVKFAFDGHYFEDMHRLLPQLLKCPAFQVVNGCAISRSTAKDPQFRGVACYDMFGPYCAREIEESNAICVQSSCNSPSCIQNRVRFAV